jgi:hypothetical protein
MTLSLQGTPVEVLVEKRVFFALFVVPKTFFKPRRHEVRPVFYSPRHGGNDFQVFQPSITLKVNGNQ